MLLLGRVGAARHYTSARVTRAQEGLPGKMSRLLAAGTPSLRRRTIYLEPCRLDGRASSPLPHPSSTLLPQPVTSSSAVIFAGRRTNKLSYELSSDSDACDTYSSSGDDDSFEADTSPSLDTALTSDTSSAARLSYLAAACAGVCSDACTGTDDAVESEVYAAPSPASSIHTTGS